MTPRVGARGEFGFLLAGRASNLQRGTIRFDRRAVNEISRRFADEILAAQSRQRIVLIDEWSARGREPAVGLALRRAVARVVVFEIGRVIGALLPPRMRPRNRVSARVFFFSSRRRHTRWTGDWSSDVCSSD